MADTSQTTVLTPERQAEERERARVITKRWKARAEAGAAPEFKLVPGWLAQDIARVRTRIAEWWGGNK